MGSSFNDGSNCSFFCTFLIRSFNIEKKKNNNGVIIEKRTQRGLRYAERVELGQPVALGRRRRRRHGRQPAADAVPLLPRPALVSRRPVLVVLMMMLVLVLVLMVLVTDHPGRAAHGRFQVAAAARVPVLEPLVVGPAEHGPVPDAVVVALAQHRAARVTRETLDVVHELLGPHHQVAGADAALAPGAPLGREQPAGETESRVSVVVVVGGAFRPILCVSVGAVDVCAFKSKYYSDGSRPWGLGLGAVTHT